MLNKEDFLDKLNQSIAVCQMHYQRMLFARNRTIRIFPLNIVSYQELTDEQISYTDQLIYRFSKLQDTMGNKLFPLILEGLQEDLENLAFIDILSKIEKLGIIDDSKQWLILRETRNVVTHEYPFQLDQLIDGLNQLIEQVNVLSKIWKDIEGYARQRFIGK